MKSLLVLGVVVFVLPGCIIDPRHVENDFGNSVRQMVAAQIQDPEAATNPDPLAPDFVDGVAIDTSVEQYRDDFKRERKEAERLTISVN